MFAWLPASVDETWRRGPRMPRLQRKRSRVDQILVCNDGAQRALFRMLCNKLVVDDGEGEKGPRGEGE